MTNPAIAEPRRRALGPETLEGALAHAGRVLDAESLKALAAAHPKGSERKYLAIEPWFTKKWGAIELLGLDRGPKRRILDLGTGPAHFPFLCRYLGHECLALDMPGIPLYDDLCRLIGVEKLDHRIEPRRPLPRFEQPFDLVTAFMIGFNTRADGTLFDLDDWSYFLHDVRDRLLVPGGRLCLKMIAQANRQGPKFETPELQALFRSHGARLTDTGRYALFEPLV